MCGLLVWFQLPAVCVGVPLSVPERDATLHIAVTAPSEPEEIIMAYPPLFVLELSVDGIYERLRHIWVDIVYMDMAELIAKHGAMGYTASSGTQVVEMFRLGKIGYYPLRQLAFAPHIRYSVSHIAVL